MATKIGIRSEVNEIGNTANPDRDFDFMIDPRHDAESRWLNGYLPSPSPGTLIKQGSPP